MKKCLALIFIVGVLLVPQWGGGTPLNPGRQDDELGLDPTAVAGGNSLPKPRLSLKALDLSRAPTTKELIAAGQLGGPLSPTHTLSNKGREAKANLSFGKAMDAWNRHDYVRASGMLREHMEEFPDSPWVDEAALHLGCDASYNGRYSEAEELFYGILNRQAAKTGEGAVMIAHKSRQRLALVKVRKNNLDEASWLFTELQNSPDWRHRTYASHWIQRLSRYKASRRNLLDCGPKALAYVLKQSGHDSKNLEGLAASDDLGFSMQSVVDLGRRQGLELAAIQIAGEDLDKLQLPVIVQINAKHPGDSGHYWVLDRLQGNLVELYDPQSNTRFRQTLDEFCREWDGNTILFADSTALPGRPLTANELSEFWGGCCGVPRPPDENGDPCENGNGGPECEDDQCSLGAPRWSVNVINMNLFVTDTPLWYDPPIGPPVRISLSYNSQSSITQHAPFGNKWQFNYASYVTVDTAGSVLVYMPDGRYDLFSPDGTGGYTQPYQVNNKLTKIAENHFELRLEDDSVYVYNIPTGSGSQQPFLVEMRDAYGQSLHLGYDEDVNLTSITDAQGKVFSLTYTTNGLCTSVADPFGRSADFEYDTAGNLAKITDMGGYWSALTYDADIYLTSISDERGTTTFWIEPAGGINDADPYPPPGSPMWENYRITVTDPLGQSQEYYYDGFSQYAWYVSPRDYVPWVDESKNTFFLSPKTRYDFAFTSSGQRAEIDRITYPEGGYIEYGIDTTSGYRMSVADAHGHTAYSTFNAMGRVTSATDANGGLTALVYATNGLDLVSVSNGLGQILMTYNSQHDLLSLTDRLTNSTTFTYNPFGQVSSQVDMLGVTNEYVYDATNRLEEFRRAGQTLVRFTHDDVGRVRTRTDANGLTVTNDYNELNQLVRVTYSDGRFESYEYATCCPRVLDSFTDRAGRTTYYEYDELKRLVRTANPEGGVTQFGYDGNGNRTALTDPNGNTTTFDYDLDNRLISKIHADGQGMSFGYDQTGLLTTRTNARSIVTTYTYDANHNLLSTSYSDDTPGVTNTYDAFNRLAGVQDGVGVHAYTYDANSRLISCDGPWVDDTITYEYDASGQRTNIAVQGTMYPTQYEYDQLKRLVSVNVGPDSYTYGYTNTSRIAQRLDRPNGSYTVYEYDDINRLTTLSNRRSTGEVINEFLYTYNTQDLRANEAISNGPTFAFTNQHVISDYNQVNQQLTSEPPGQALAYDKDGNMVCGTTPSGERFSAVYDAKNRLQTLTVTNDTAVTVKIQYLYSWNNLVAQEIRESPGEGTNEIRHLRDRYLPLQERNGENAVVRDYTWASRRMGGINNLLALWQGTEHYSYLYDGKGNVAAVLDALQASVATYDYDEFGVVLASDGPLFQPFRFSTKPYECSSGLSYFGYRFYSAFLGRWLSMDPLGERDSDNLYTFVGNTPVNAIDPYGLWQYGNWGGPGRVNGQTDEWTEDDDFPREGDPDFVPPKDAQDRCYYRHDVCLRDAGKIKCKTARQKQRKTCDRALAQCLAGVPRSQRNFKWWQAYQVFKRFHPNDNPGDYHP